MATHLLLLFNFLFFFAPPKTEAPKSIYDFKVTAIDGSTIDLSKYKGKKILIVNTASECGNTPQYAGLEKLYRKYNGKLVILGFPANDFGAQEPGTDKEIASFCSKNYHVTFPMASKISVKGDDMASIYKWLTQKKHNGFKDSEVRWNFQKYLVNEKGNLVAVFEPGTQPVSDEVVAAIEQ